MDKTEINKIRNFSIIAHIDHGKSTLADRLMEVTGAVRQRDIKERMLDTLELEQERGITIKLQTVRMNYNHKNEDYILNLIDTPGHVDFSYEVSRSLAASEGALLLVDATQGIQAQTLTNMYKALENNLEIIPVINKVDLPSAQIEKTEEEIISTFGFKREEILRASGKTGIGIENILDTIIERVPSPQTRAQKEENETKMLIYDSFYHEHKGVIALVRVISGELKTNDRVYVMGTKTTIEPLEIGYLKPSLEKNQRLVAGEVGYIATGLKDIKMVHVGDTVVLKSEFENNNSIKALPGYKQPKPMVFVSLFPVEADDFKEFQEALEKLSLNDAALTYEKETSIVLGSGFVVGFLGLLHMEITQERLEREFDVNLIATSPSVEYLITLSTNNPSKIAGINLANVEGDILRVRTANEFPDTTYIKEIKEPWIKSEIITPEQYIGQIMELIQSNRGEYVSMNYLTETAIKGSKHVMITANLPTAEVIVNFFDKLKSVTQGYASMDYNFLEYRCSDVTRVTILVNYEQVEALSFLTHKTNSERRGKEMVSKLRTIIPRHQFKVPIQASISGRVIARETIQAYKKDVTAKLYGGDITRKMKLREKQKKGKKRLKMFGNVEIPKEAFLAALKKD
ncbi:elongation factor 4 [Candidatus Dojkabacteria bacterium]|nr:elongation factor 4 [Candidatus Dojkabacteria bacterium]